MKYYLYIILTYDNTLYCGIAVDFTKRFIAHKKGLGAKYTKVHKPKEIVYIDEFKDRSEASKEEHRIKSLKRDKKLELIEQNKTRTEKFLKKFE